MVSRRPGEELIASILATVISIALAASGCLGCSSAPEVPLVPVAWVTDGAAFMTAPALERVDTTLKAYELRTGHQVLVWIERKLPKRVSIEAFGLLAFNSWGVGRKGIDDGAVLFVFVEDKALRIQVGYGLERSLSNRVCARIIRDVIVPQVQKGNRDAAIIDGVAAILAAIEGNSVEVEKP